jgi:Holliday junction resolvasome RuvABC endonuclease subunit
MNVKLLAFDVSSSCIGNAIIGIENNTVELIKYGNIKPPKKEKASIVERLDMVCKEIEKLCSEYKPDHIVIEDIVQFMAHRSTAKTIITLGVFNRVVALQVYKTTNKIPLFLLPVSIRSKLSKIIGIGKIAKEDIPEILQQFFDKEQFKIKYKKNGSIDKTIFDEADAIAAALAGGIHLGIIPITITNVTSYSKEKK